MMMGMLQAGGIPLLTDSARPPDKFNPGGYHEYTPVLNSRKCCRWIAEAEGKAVKVIYALLSALPADRSYRIIFMLRDIEEVVKSQRALLVSTRSEETSVTDEELASVFTRERVRCLEWIDTQSHFQVLRLSYSAILTDPFGSSNEIATFLGRSLNIDSMTRSVNSSLRHFC